MTGSDRIDLKRNAGDALAAFAGVEQTATVTSLNRHLRDLVKLRASQINGCAYCVGMHTSEARQDGETSERLDRLVVWREVDDFTDEERAALAWTEALTRLDDPDSLTGLHRQLARHYSSAEISALTVVAAMINVWNRLHIASEGGLRDGGTRHAA